MRKKILVIIGIVACVLGIVALSFLSEKSVNAQKEKDYKAILAYLHVSGPSEPKLDKADLVHWIVRGDFDGINLDEADYSLLKNGYATSVLDDGRYRKISLYYTAGIVFLLIFAMILGAIYIHFDRLDTMRENEDRQTQLERLVEIENKRTNLELQRNQNYLENVAHQIRTKLTNAQLNIDMAQYASTPESVEKLEEAQFHLDRIEELLCQLLRIGRLESGAIPFEKQEVEIGDFIEEIVDKRPDRDRITKSIEPVVAVVDSNWLYEAVVSLIDNCFDNIEAKDTVGISTAAVSKKLVIKVWDTGRGFENVDLEHIFDRYYSKPGNKQTVHFGIGLNLAKIVVDAHDGSIRAYNNEAGGACFEMQIPLHTELKINKVSV